GVMSACFAYGLASGEPIRQITMRHLTPNLWQGLPVLIAVLLGGFTTNFIWCAILNFRNRTGHQYFRSGTGAELPAERREHALEKDRKSTRLNSSHVAISYAVFCLKKKKQKIKTIKLRIETTINLCLTI